MSPRVLLLCGAVAGCYLLGLSGRLYAADWLGAAERAAGAAWVLVLAWRVSR